MTDYAKITDFTAKDALASGNPAKVVKGVDIDAELAAISVAILSKFDSADLATQAEAEAGTDNTKVMTPLRVSQQVAAAVDSVVKYKTATETVSNSTTLQDDDHLASWTLAAGGVYHILGVLKCSFKVASDIKLLLTNTNAPSSISLTYRLIGATNTSETFSTSNSSASSLTGAGSDEEVIILIEGIVVAHASGSTMKLQWAQNAAVVENTVLGIGSFIMATRMA